MTTKVNKTTSKTRIPPPPGHLTDIARREWRRAAKELAGLGLLRTADMATLAIYSQAWARLVAAENELAKSGTVIMSPKNYPIQNPWLSIANKAAAQVDRAARQLGLTPAARQKIATSNADQSPGVEMPPQ